jgi:hypothetical protein
MIQRQYRLFVASGLFIAGIVVAVLGYIGVSSETEVPFQLPYFASAGIGALLLFGAGATLFLSTQLDADRERLEEIEDAVRTLADEVGRLADESAQPGRGGRRRSA